MTVLVERSDARLDTARIDVEIVVPVYNEERDLARSVRRLHDYLRDSLPFTAIVTIADNASTDSTWTVASGLADELPNVRAVHLDQKGRGRALHQVWAASAARVVAYMDVDLSTDLNALLPLVAPLLSGHSDMAIGSRLTRSRVWCAAQARIHLAQLQPAAARDPAGALLGCPVRVQGYSDGMRAGAAAVRPRPSLVL